MLKISTEHVAILLEVISFFCVTTDLYGKKRLEELRSRLIISVNKTEKTEDPQILVEVVGWVSLGVFIYFMRGQFIETYDFFKERIISDFSIVNLITLILAVCVLLIILCGIGFLWMMVFGASFKLLRVFALYLVKQVLRIASFEGLLLAIGTILFLLSKIISYTHIE